MLYQVENKEELINNLKNISKNKTFYRSAEVKIYTDFKKIWTSTKIFMWMIVARHKFNKYRKIKGIKKSKDKDMKALLNHEQYSPKAKANKIRIK